MNARFQCDEILRDAHFDLLPSISSTHNDDVADVVSFFADQFGSIPKSCNERSSIA